MQQVDQKGMASQEIQDRDPGLPEISPQQPSLPQELVEAVAEEIEEDPGQDGEVIRGPEAFEGSVSRCPESPR